MEPAIVAILMASPAVTSLVGDRIKPSAAPQRLARPNIVYERYNLTTTVTNTGVVRQPVASLQVTAYADSYSEARTLANAVRKALDNYRGQVTDSAGTTWGLVVRLDGDRDLPIARTPGNTVEVYGVALQFKVRWKDQ